MITTARTAVTWKELRACDPNYFKGMDDEFEQAHRFTAQEAVPIIVGWFKSQPLDCATNRDIMKRRLNPELYIMALEAIIEDM